MFNPFTIKITNIYSWKKLVATSKKSDALVKSSTEKTILYKTIQASFIHGLDKETLKKYSLNPELSLFKGGEAELHDRFPFASPAELHSITSNIQRESKLVSQLISNSGLSSWSKGIFSDAQQATGTEQDGTKFVEKLGDEDYDMIEDTERDGDVVME